jgi:hypothetical protein
VYECIAAKIFYNFHEEGKYIPCDVIIESLGQVNFLMFVHPLNSKKRRLLIINDKQNDPSGALRGVTDKNNTYLSSSFIISYTHLEIHRNFFNP